MMGKPPSLPPRMPAACTMCAVLLQATPAVVKAQHQAPKRAFTSQPICMPRVMLRCN